MSASCMCDVSELYRLTVARNPSLVAEPPGKCMQGMRDSYAVLPGSLPRECQRPHFGRWPAASTSPRHVRVSADQYRAPQPRIIASGYSWTCTGNEHASHHLRHPFAHQSSAEPPWECWTFRPSSLDSRACTTPRILCCAGESPRRLPWSFQAGPAL